MLSMFLQAMHPRFEKISIVVFLLEHIHVVDTLTSSSAHCDTDKLNVLYHSSLGRVSSMHTLLECNH